MRMRLEMIVDTMRMMMTMNVKFDHKEEMLNRKCFVVSFSLQLILTGCPTKKLNACWCLHT